MCIPRLGALPGDSAISINFIFPAIFVPSPAFAIAASLAAGPGWAAAGFCLVALFERRSVGYILVNGGYLIVAFLAMGLVLGFWPQGWT